MALTRVLVANRAEIGLRLVRGCHAAGLEAIAAHVAGEADAPYVLEADGAVEVAGFLTAATLAEAARATGCDALHPGYGFLSERAELAEACAGAGVVFVGPGPDALRSLGDKVAARDLAVAAGFRLVPGGDDRGRDRVPAAGQGRGGRRRSRHADRARAGGAGRRDGVGGPRGRRRLRRPVAATVSEYLEGARHVEVQALGDGQGGAVHLGLRDCSLQRRHQKVLEEAPAPGVGEDEAAELGAAACRLLRSVDYAGAATVELLRAADGTAYFLEVNARLQVEHPVTELVTGADLVALQLAIAGGEALPAELAWRPQGHAVEARLVAEDADHGFLHGRAAAAVRAAGQRPRRRRLPHRTGGADDVRRAAREADRARR